VTREILCGPAGSGKTRQVLDEYVATIAEHGEDAALLVLPTRLACDRVRRRLATDERLRGLLDARILTFPDLAQRILDANHANVTQISELQQRLLMRQVAAELCAEGALRVLTPMCEFPGFIDVLREDVEEIKRTALRPEEFARLIERGGPAGGAHAPRNLEFARVYARYQQRLQALNLYDDAGRFWQALDELRGGRRRPFEELRTILVDGFDDFTTTQLRVLHALAQGDGVERLVISLCLERDEERRPELFTRPRRTLERIAAVFGEMPQRWLEPAGSDGPLAAMGARLFAEGPEAPLAAGRDAVEVVEASGQRMEVRQVLGRVKRLLLGGTDARRIALIVRDPGGYRRALSEIAAELGVPLDMQASESVASRPSVQAVLDIVRVPAGKLRASDVMRLLKSSYLNRAVLSDEALDPNEIERVCAAASIIGGRAESGSPPEHCRGRLRRYAGRLQAEQDTRTRHDDEEQRWFRGSDEELAGELRLIGRVAVALTNLFGAFAPLAQAGTLPAHVKALAEVMDAFGTLKRFTRPEPGEDGPIAGEAAANVAAASTFLEALRELHGAEEQLGIVSEMTLGDFHDELLRLAQSTSFVPPGSPAGVTVIDAGQARQLAFEHVFVLGMTERQFPRVASEDALFGDDERERLARAGIPLDQRRESVHEDAFLFYSIAVSARERLTLSYPGTDAEGQQALRSYFVDEVERCFEGGVPRAEYGLARQVPSPGDAASERELLEAMLFGAFGYDVLLDAERRDEGVSALRAWGAAYEALPHLQVLSHLHGMIALQDRRAGWEPLDEYDGRLGPEAALEVAGLYGPDRCFSASALQQYGRCPWTFLAERVLRLAEVTEPSEDIDRRLLGSIVHRCLRGFFDRWRVHREDLCIEEGDRDAAVTVLDEVVGSTFEDEARHGTVGDEVVFAIEREKIRVDLHAWLDYEIEELQPEGHTAWAMEQQFGYDRTDPVEIGEGEARVLLRGQVDRIDRLGEIDGAPAFAVYDYKTGSIPAKKRMTDGGDFQLPIYALAGRRILSNPDAVCLDWGYYSVRRPVKLANRPGKKDPAGEIEEYTRGVEGWVLAYAALIRAGEFAPQAPPQCGRWCAFRGICRWDEFRFARKQQGTGGQTDE